MKEICTLRENCLYFDVRLEVIFHWNSDVDLEATDILVEVLCLQPYYEDLFENKKRIFSGYTLRRSNAAKMSNARRRFL